LRNSADQRGGRARAGWSGGAGGARRLAPRKSMGQNFLQDAELAQWIAEQAEPGEADLVIEAGPGTGALTRHLAGMAGRLLLVEKDEALAADLRARYGAESGVEVLEADASRFDLRPFYQRGRVHFVGNLPYSMGGEILRHVLTPPTPVSLAVVMLQKEVCERLAAAPGSPGCAAVSALVWRDWQVEWLRQVGPEVFHPRPKVDSAVLRLRPRDPAALPVHDRGVFERLVRHGFSQRRKQLKNLLPTGFEDWEGAAAALGLAASARAEELSLEHWVALARWQERRPEVDAGQSSEEVFDVVDELDQVIETRTRGEVHRLGLRHRAVHVFVFNRRGELFLQQRSHLKDVAPLRWDSSAAGHLDSGETYAEAVIREVREELGVTTSGGVRAGKLAAGPETDHEFVELHVLRHHGPVRYPAEEVRTGDWFRPEVVADWVEARPRDFARGFVSCWRLWLEAGKPLPEGVSSVPIEGAGS
jgi:16S rRNA (adenine1518-N6/adenine1519-N6)-dimethyltransferase